MKYWNYKINYKINTFEDLPLLKEKISKDKYDNISNMLEWNLLNYDEKLNCFKFRPIFNLIFNTIRFDYQVEKEIKILAQKEPYIIDWLLQNWNQIVKDLNFKFSSKELIKLLISSIKTINYDFKFDLKNIESDDISNQRDNVKFFTDQWNVRFFTDSELFKFIDDEKKNKKIISITYLFNKDSTLESIANEKNPKVTRERIRQIFNKEIRKNNVFFKRTYEFFKKNIFSINEVNKTAIKVIEKQLYPMIKESDSLLNVKNQIILDFRNSAALLSDLNFDSTKLEILYKNNCFVFNKGNIYRSDEKYWGEKSLSFKEMLEIFLEIRYKDTQILDTEELRIEFCEFLLENNKFNNNYNFLNSRAFEGLIVRTKKLLYFDRDKIIVSLYEERKNSEVANVILNEFINLKKQGIIMVSVGKFIELFNSLTNYRFLDMNPDAIHNFLKKYSTIENKEKYFSRTPILINIERTDVLNIFYKQVQILFKNTKVINWNIFLDILKNECGFEKTLVQNYVSDGYIYMTKNDNNVILL